MVLSRLLAVPRPRNSWEVAIAVLGVNLWVALLLLPALHLERPGLGAGAWTLALLPLAALGLGLLLRRRVLLVGVYPGLLLLCPLASPRLVGDGVYTPLTFSLMALSLLAYLAVTLGLLGVIDAPPVPSEGRDLAPLRLGARWRRRLRIHRWMAALAALIPAVLLAVAFLHPGLQEDLRTFYPRRARAAQALVGVLAIGLWMAIFYAYFLVPLRAHVRGDPGLRRRLRQLHQLHRGRTGRGRRPGALFYVTVGAALGLMALLLLLRG